MKLIENWHRELLRLWSIRWAIGFAALQGLWASWDTLQQLIPWWVLIPAGVVISIALRLLKQKDPSYGNDA